jgi:hypothetical protein
MFKPLLLALLAACGAPSSVPDEIRPSDDALAGHYFCCHDVNSAKLTGDGCITIGKEQVDQCSTVLYCGDSFTQKDGTVTCAQ